MSLWLTRGLGGLGRGIETKREQDRVEAERQRVEDERQRMAGEREEQRKLQELGFRAQFVGMGGHIGDPPEKAVPVDDEFAYTRLDEPDMPTSLFGEPQQNMLRQGMAERMPQFEAPDVPIMREPSRAPDTGYMDIGEMGGQRMWLPSAERRAQMDEDRALALDERRYGIQQQRSDDALREIGEAALQTVPWLAEHVGDDPLKIGRMVSVPALWSQIERLRPFDRNDPEFQRQVALFREQYEALGRAYGGGKPTLNPEQQVYQDAYKLGMQEMLMGTFNEQRANEIAQSVGQESWAHLLGVVMGGDGPVNVQFQAAPQDIGQKPVPEEDARGLFGGIKGLFGGGRQRPAAADAPLMDEDIDSMLAYYEQLQQELASVQGRSIPSVSAHAPLGDVVMGAVGRHRDAKEISQEMWPIYTALSRDPRGAEALASLGGSPPAMGGAQPEVQREVPMATVPDMPLPDTPELPTTTHYSDYGSPDLAIPGHTVRPGGIGFPPLSDEERERARQDPEFRAYLRRKGYRSSYWE